MFRPIGARPRLYLQRLVLEAGRLLVISAIVLRRYVDQARARTERHRLPVVAAERPRSNVGALRRVVGAGNLHGAARLEVHVRGPVHGHIRVGREQLTRRPVEHVEEAVLRRLHDHLAHASADRQVGQHHRLDGRVIPGIARHRLVVPDQLAVVGIDRQNRRQVQVVAAAGAADLPVPRRAIAGADVQQIDLGVVDDRIPHRAAAAVLPPVVPLPGGECRFERLGFLRLRRVSRHGVEAPRELAGVRVVGGHVPAHAVLGAAVADDDLAVGNPRRAGDRVRLLLVDRRRLPRHLAALGVDRHQPPVEHADVHTPLVEGRAAVHDIAARQLVVLAVHLGVVFPQLLTGPRIDRVGDAPRPGGVHHAVDDQRRRLETAIGPGLERPGQAQGRSVGVVDLVKRAEALLVVVAPVRQPVLASRLHPGQGSIVHGSRGLLRGDKGRPHDGQSGEGSDERANHVLSFVARRHQIPRVGCIVLGSSVGRKRGPPPGRKRHSSPDSIARRRDLKCDPAPLA